MLVQLGNAAPKHSAASGDDAPHVTYVHVPDAFDAEGVTHYDFDPSIDMAAFRQHIVEAHSPYLSPDRQGITRVSELGHGNQEALLTLVHPLGIWPGHASKDPIWVHSETHPEFSQMLAEHYGCNHGAPAGLEDTHHTMFGPPGVGPQAGPLAPQALKVNAGNDIQAALLGGGQVDLTGIATASGATSLTATGTPFVSSAYIGCRVYASVSSSQLVWGLVISNTTSVLTVDRWYTVGTPGGAAGSTPSSTAVYVIVGAGGPAAWFVGLTATATAPSATDTSLTGEITTASGGLIRKISPYAHTAGTNTYTLTPVFTANGSDSLPVTVAQIGVFNSMVSTDTATTMLFRTLLSATATLTTSGDQLTVTETVTM